MGRKDFVLIAETLREAYPPAFAPGDEAVDAWTRTVELFADSLRTTNPQFKRERFIEHCQPK